MSLVIIFFLGFVLAVVIGQKLKRAYETFSVK